MYPHPFRLSSFVTNLIYGQRYSKIKMMPHHPSILSLQGPNWPQTRALRNSFFVSVSKLIFLKHFFLNKKEETSFFFSNFFFWNMFLKQPNQACFRCCYFFFKKKNNMTKKIIPNSPYCFLIMAKRPRKVWNILFLLPTLESLYTSHYKHLMTSGPTDEEQTIWHLQITASKCIKPSACNPSYQHSNYKKSWQALAALPNEKGYTMNNHTKRHTHRNVPTLNNQLRTLANNIEKDN